MPSFELNKLQGVSPARALSESDRSLLKARANDTQSAASPSAAKSGISVEVSQSAAASDAPVDSERVNEIRNALRDGSYPLVPAKIVDAMIAARVSPSIPQSSQS